MTKAELKEWIADLRETLLSQKEATKKAVNKLHSFRDTLNQGGFQSSPELDAVIDSFESYEWGIQRKIEYLDGLSQSLQE